MTIKDDKQNLRVLITGTRGSLGKALLNSLKRIKVEVYEADIIDRSNTINLLKDYELDNFNIILHLGASSKRSNKISDIINKNIYVTEKLFYKASKLKKIKVIFASANSVISSKSQKRIDMSTPFSVQEFYSSSKLIGESLLLDYLGRERSSIIRLPAIYGTNNKEGLIHRLITLSKKNQDIHIDDPKCLFNNAITLSCVVDFLEKIIIDIDKINGNDFLIAADEEISLISMAKKIINRMNSKSKIVTRNSVMSEEMNYLIDTSLAKQFGLKPEKMINIVDMVCASYE